MKATGIVRRIDDLGRVVIPKEIRRTMKIREGAPLEIYTDREGVVIFKKYSPVGEMNGFAEEYAETLHKTCGLGIIICDRDSIITLSGVSKREFLEKNISKEISELIEERSIYSYIEGSEKVYITDDNREYFASVIAPIVSEGDVIGCVISVVSDKNERIDSELELKLIQTAAVFLGKRIDD